jgi:hypothetical protein
MIQSVIHDFRQSTFSPPPGLPHLGEGGESILNKRFGSGKLSHNRLQNRASSKLHFQSFAVFKFHILHVYKTQNAVSHNRI